ncbi:MAG: efflux RND transporter periplasmic adaptor subunit [Planctomycetes bacterium]|nr:efflux RND transporter periplasmic adaptor subunit [Planctomycetota bacterium]
MVRALIRGVLTLAVLGGLALAFYAVGHDGRLPWQPPPTHGEDWCSTHQVPLSEDEVCNPKLARGGLLVARDRGPKEGECPNTLVRITAPAEVVERAGIQLFKVEPRPVTETLRTTAETAYLPTKFARVAPRTGGVVREVKAAVGDVVEPGTILALLDSREMAEAVTGYRQAVAVRRLREKTHAQEKDLAEKKISSGRELLVAVTELEEANLAVAAARQRLLTLGLADGRVTALETGEEPGSTVEVAAPFAGTVLEAVAVLGENASPERPLFVIAETSRMWLHIDLHEQDLPKIEKDQRVVFTLDGLPGQRFVGKVTAIGGSVDERTRTLRVIADLKNSQGLLREHMFGHADVTVRPAEPKMLVPRIAVQTDGDCHFVFVSSTANVFKSRKVDLGVPYQDAYEITGGLASGEQVVTVGSFALKTEVLRGEMGAG